MAYSLPHRLHMLISVGWWCVIIACLMMYKIFTLCKLCLTKGCLCLYRTKKGLARLACGDITVFGWYLYGAFAGLSESSAARRSSIVALVVWFGIFGPLFVDS